MLNVMNVLVLVDHPFSQFHGWNKGHFSWGLKRYPAFEVSVLCGSYCRRFFLLCSGRAQLSLLRHKANSSPLRFFMYWVSADWTPANASHILLYVKLFWKHSEYILITNKTAMRIFKINDRISALWGPFTLDKLWLILCQSTLFWTISKIKGSCVSISMV